ncbi:MAG: glutathione S-transferase family protein [Proteobacteria bacterium]|nr:glutathione S-transferase family protein [Pseudomonadota bacterium]
MSDIELYGFPPSSYTWSARIACAEKGVSYDLKDPEFGTVLYSKLHPFSKMPVMVHGDFKLYETSAMLRYLDTAFEGPSLQPADVKAAAVMDQWISAYNDYVYPVIAIGMVIQRVVVPMRGGVTDEELVKTSAEKASHQLSVLEEALTGNDYLAGESYSLADIIFAPILWYLAKLPEGEALYRDRPAVLAWRERIESRAAFIDTIPSMPQANAA